MFVQIRFELKSWVVVFILPVITSLKHDQKIEFFGSNKVIRIFWNMMQSRNNLKDIFFLNDNEVRRIRNKSSKWIERDLLSELRIRLEEGEKILTKWRVYWVGEGKFSEYEGCLSGGKIFLR